MNVTAIFVFINNYFNYYNKEKNIFINSLKKKNVEIVIFPKVMKV